jgi:hypothetical protein
MLKRTLIDKLNLFNRQRAWQWGIVVVMLTPLRTSLGSWESEVPVDLHPRIEIMMQVLLLCDFSLFGIVANTRDIHPKPRGMGRYRMRWTQVTQFSTSMIDDSYLAS